MNKKLLISGAVAAATVVGALGGATLTALQSFAATDSATTTQAQPSVRKDPALGGHVGRNGVKEELLAGDTAEKVKSAALKAVVGGTIQRVETDAEGAVYEAHMTKSDGSRVTVKFDANFGVTSTESGQH